MQVLWNKQGRVDGIQHSMMKEKIKKEHYQIVRLVLRSELNASNEFEAINSLAVSVVTNSFNIINWKKIEVQRTDAKIGKLLTMARMHHPRADVDRLYILRMEGGRGLIKLELSLKATTVGVDTNLQKLKTPCWHW